MGKEGVVLEHHAKAAILGLQLIHALVIDIDAPASRAQKTCDAIESRGLSAA